MLSVVLATFNEASNLGRCLESIQKIADEIVAVDGDSTDATREIATSFGARVIKTTNKANFHINKQMAIDAAKGDLILQLDADEVVDDELFEFIKKVRVDGDVVAWNIKRKNYFLGKPLKKGGQYPDPVIRLFVAHKAHLPQKNVHEQMLVDGEVATADGHLLHYPYPDLNSYFRKFNTYTSFEAKRQFALGVQASWFRLSEYFLLKPLKIVFSLFIRHRGYVDGIRGFLFALLSAMHHPVIFLKIWELE
ncbi:MAG: hypothetical protein COY80_04725 [Candidatus Pacebacteria bacterium CG_4_10_14_0_8_um_filter_42_14]|nr:MAG: hypothetical protein COY80_04725 [Candidatus Pacebacteria bacterium CG_4_10_14_0_8_um_filter_42_14]